MFTVEVVFDSVKYDSMLLNHQTG